MLVDTKNILNYIKRAGMLWTVNHLWPSRDLFFKLLSLLVIIHFAEREWDGNIYAH